MTCFQRFTRFTAKKCTQWKSGHCSCPRHWCKGWNVLKVVQQVSGTITPCQLRQTIPANMSPRVSQPGNNRGAGFHFCQVFDHIHTWLFPETLHWTSCMLWGHIIKSNKSYYLIPPLIILIDMFTKKSIRTEKWLAHQLNKALDLAGKRSRCQKCIYWATKLIVLFCKHPNFTPILVGILSCLISPDILCSK